ncbi:MAG: amylo-alpha-1,6-glucosidase [Pelotomaculum sp.]|jgi:predicted glycogen debranching enzyme
MYFFGKEDWRTLEKGIEHEWLVTNGIGGYASGTIINLNTRKYHGLLIAAHNPPGHRVLHLAKLDERFHTGDCTYILAANENRSGFVEYGFIHLQQVKAEPLPTFTYSFADITLVKTIFMVHGQNTTLINYQVFNGAKKAVLTLTPMINNRGHHHITSRGEIKFTQQNKEGRVLIKGREGLPPLLLAISSGTYIPDESWYNGMAYAGELERGENPYEDHFIPGRFEIPLAPGEVKTFTVAASTEETVSLFGEALLEAERERLKSLVRQAGYGDDLACSLVQAADAFIVQRRSTGKESIIAGYPWFDDWGRDAMIALPGLTLVTKRFADAREVLLTFARHCRRGLLPNAFFDGLKEPVYNTVDASLWFVNAVYQFLIYTGDLDFVREKLYPVARDIIQWYKEGTDFHIRMDADGLITAGSEELQLTWMDAKVDRWVVTPRHGKAVEINALWYNAVSILNALSTRLGFQMPWPDLPARIKDSFIAAFWDEENNYLNDVVTPEGPDKCLRPNQLMAVSLPFTMLNRAMGRQVVQRVWQELYATYGIRSLSPSDSCYKGVYLGDRLQRDGAYHQGTAWSWLMGPFITAYRRVNGYSPASRAQARRFIQPFRSQLREHGVGYISEIFDADEPVYPRGCYAQAWGVAEVLRALVEDVLEIRPPYEEKLDMG